MSSEIGEATNLQDQYHRINAFSKLMHQEISENGDNAEVYTDTDEKPVITKTYTEQQEETKTKQYICDVCKEVLCNSSNIKEHMRQHKRSRPLHCSRCDQYFVLADNFRAHKKQHEIDDSIPCPECGKRLKSVYSLTTHMKQHEHNEAFECGICCKSFNNATVLVGHMESHSSSPIYTCNICQAGARSQKLLDYHQMKLHNIYNTVIYRFSCKICDTRFKSKSGLYTHKKKHSTSSIKFLSEKVEQLSSKQDNGEPSERTVTVSEVEDNMDVSENITAQVKVKSLTNDVQYSNHQDFQCLPDEMVAETDRADDLSTHVDVIKIVRNSSVINNTEQSLEKNKNRVDSVSDIAEENSDNSIEMISECEIADDTSNSHSETPTSIDNANVHKGDELRKFIDRFVADTMGYSDKEEDNMEYNDKDIEENIEGNDESKHYKCDLCSHEFEGRETIKAHMLQHNNLKPHYCTRCDLYFVLARNMRSHLVKHEEEDPLVCQLCNELFQTIEGLKNHNMTHQEYFPYKCSICNRGFQTQVTLNMHLRFHTKSASEIECSICLDTFPSKVLLKSHMRKIHFIYDKGKGYIIGCNLCQMKFKSADGLWRHKRYSHNIPWSELLSKNQRRKYKQARGGFRGRMHCV